MAWLPQAHPVKTGAETQRQPTAIAIVTRRWEEGMPKDHSHASEADQPDM